MSRCKAGKPALFDRVELAFWDNKTDLKIIASVEEHEQFPVSKNPSDWGGSFSRLEIRIQSTSIGAPNSWISSFPFACVIEWRPSAPMIKISSHFALAGWALSRGPRNLVIFKKQIDDFMLHVTEQRWGSALRGERES